MGLFGNLFGKGSKKADGNMEESNLSYDYEEDEDGEEEAISEWDAADIWLSNGMDEDYTLDYDVNDLLNAL
jgi:hypothetical protein